MNLKTVTQITETAKAHGAEKVTVNSSNTNFTEDYQATVTPSGFHSYRGHYQHLALDFTFDEDGISIDEFLELCREANGQTFEGWKDGDFLMDDCSEVYVDNPGYSRGFFIDGFEIVPTEKSKVLSFKLREEEV